MGKKVDTMKRSLFAFLIIILLAGCAPWIRTGGPYTAEAQNVTVSLPDGWMRMNTDEFVFVTRDGGLLQNILIEAFHIDETLANTKKKLRKGMLPLEACEVIIDNNSSNQDITSFEVKENKSARIDGHQGFRAVFAYKNRNGLKLKSVYYGFMDGEWFYGIRYTAPQRHYFDKDIKTFEKMVASLRLARRT
jgi:putative VirB-like lipoprotein